MSKDDKKVSAGTDTGTKAETSPGRRRFIKYGIAGAIGFGVASAIELPILNNTIQNDNSKITNLNNQISTLQSQIATLQESGPGFLTLNPSEQVLVEAIAETVIPSDASGPGAKEAGAVYFIDRMLAGNYGKGGNMYLQGPFVLPQKGAVSVAGAVYPNTSKATITYSGGTIAPRLQAGTAYQYAFNPREFWRRALLSFQAYCKSTYGNNFEKLTSTQQVQAIQDLADNTPTNFTDGPTPAEFFNELHDMVTAGYWTDPLYGGNIGMVGWQLLGFPGVNSGAAQGYTTIQLATSTTPIPLPPMSLAQLQKGGKM